MYVPRRAEPCVYSLQFLSGKVDIRIPILPGLSGFDTKCGPRQCLGGPSVRILLEGKVLQFLFTL